MKTSNRNISTICKSLSLSLFLCVPFILTACTADQKVSMDSMASQVRPWRGNAEAYYQLGCHYQDRNRHREALKEFEKVIAVNPEDIRAYNGIGISCDALKDFPRAFLAYEKALKLNPQAGYVYNNLGYSYVLQKRYHEAALAFQKAADQPDSAAMKNKITTNLNMALALSEKPQAAAAGQQEFAGQPGTSAEALALSTTLDQDRYIKNMMIQRNPLAAHSPLSSPVLSSSSSDSSVPAPKANVTIEVANGNGVRNMARNVGNYLKNRGYRVVRVTNADSYSYREGNVSYRANGQTTAQEIAAILPKEIDVMKFKPGTRRDVRVRVLIGEDMIPYKKVFMEDKG